MTSIPRRSKPRADELDRNRDAIRRLLAYRQDRGSLLGLAELAFVLGLSKQNCSNRRVRGKLPAVKVELAMSPIWEAEIVLLWLLNTPL